MHDVTTIGSATVDIFMKSPAFHLQPTSEGVLLCQEYGGKIDIEDFFWQSGGAGTNTAVGFSRMGFRSAAIVEIGKDVFGAQYEVNVQTKDYLHSKMGRSDEHQMDVKELIISFKRK